MKLVVLTVALLVCAISKSEQRLNVNTIWERDSVEDVNSFESEERELDEVVEVEERCSENSQVCAMHLKWKRCGIAVIKRQCPCTCSEKKKKGNGNLPESEQIMLDRHNELRRRHGVPALAYDKTLAAKAKKWCQYLASTSKFEHSDQKNAVERTGENLYYSRGDPEDDIPLKATNAWYDEISMYDFNNPGFSGATGHFTQVVWKDSKRLGCYSSKTAESSLKRVYACCEYGPAGNWANEYRANVPRPRSG